MTTPVWDQDAFAGRCDDGSQTAAQWKFADGTCGDTVGNATNRNWTQSTDQKFRVRFVVQETSGNMAVNQKFILQYNYDGTGYTPVTTTSTHVQAVASANTSWTITDDDATTQQVGAGTFIAGVMNDDDEAGEGNTLDFAGSDETELEFILNIVGSAVADAKTVLFRVYLSGPTALDAYTSTPTVTISKPSIADELKLTATMHLSASGAMTGRQYV